MTQLLQQGMIVMISKTFCRHWTFLALPQRTVLQSIRSCLAFYTLATSPSGKFRWETGLSLVSFILMCCVNLQFVIRSRETMENGCCLDDVIEFTIQLNLQITLII